MKTSVFDGDIPYTVQFAQAVLVDHHRDFVFSHEAGRSLYAFIHVLHGQLEVVFSQTGQTLVVQEGSTVYIPKGFRSFSRYLLEDTQVAVLQFDVREDSAQPSAQQPVVMPPEATQVFRGSMERFERLDCFGCAARIYDLLSLLRQSERALAPKYRRLQPAAELLEAEPTSGQPVEYYAGLCGMSVPGFRRLFKECFGVSPVEYRNNLRLTNARKLIMSGEYSVEQAAYLSGFSNLSFFYRLFRRVYGVTPGKM